MWIWLFVLCLKCVSLSVCLLGIPVLAMVAAYSVWLQPFDGRPGPMRKVNVEFGCQLPIPVDVRRAHFLDGHVPLVGLDIPRMPREMIAHVDGSRLLHVLKVGVNSNVSSFLTPSDVKMVKQANFILANLY